MNRRVFIVLLIIFVGSVTMSFAQNFNLPIGIDLVVKNNDTLTVLGNFNQSGNFNLGEGSLYLGGSWENIGTFSKSNATIGFVGETPQTYAFDFADVGNLHMKSSAIKTLTNPLTVIGAVVFESGVLQMKEEQLLVKDGTKIRGGNKSSFFVGELVVENPVNQFFPVGHLTSDMTGTVYAPAYLTQIKGQNPVVGLSVLGEDAMLTDNSGLVKTISTVRYWKRTNIGGTFESAVVSLTILDDEDLGSGEEAVVLKAKDTNEIVETIGQSNDFPNAPAPFDFAPPEKGEEGEKTVEELEKDPIVTSREAASSEATVYVLGTETDLSDLECIPNVFSEVSPNEIDQKFIILCPQVAEENFSLRIYNRWGILVYETTSLKEAQEGWDGKHFESGKVLPLDVYEYVLIGEFNNGKPLNRQGVVTKL